TGRLGAAGWDSGAGSAANRMAELMIEAVTTEAIRKCCILDSSRSAPGGAVLIHGQLAIAAMIHQSGRARGVIAVRAQPVGLGRLGYCCRPYPALWQLRSRPQSRGEIDVHDGTVGIIDLLTLLADWGLCP
ncbi:MAG: hypothetical protein O7C65_11070, partial [Planctomycetota bacterium]|nr:hypothetical protein [Planctomycetota bacterium]